jgi:hypothetical protein
VDQWVQHGLSLYAKEACDPVQDGTYIQGGVALSNFVVASWFDGFGRGPFDYLGQLGAPFTRTAMGYFERMTAGRVVQVGARGHDRHARIVAGDTWGASLAALR